MVKINFGKLKVYNEISHTTYVEVDVRKSVAQDLYQNGQGIAFHSLALKIYNGEGEQEFSDEEYNLIMVYAHQIATPAMIDTLSSYKQD